MSSLHQSTMRSDDFLRIGGGGPKASAESELVDPLIGALLVQARVLSIEQVNQVLDHQRKSGRRFGEAAVRLGFATKDDVNFALAQQFHFPLLRAGSMLSDSLVCAHHPFGRQAESIRALRAQLTATTLAPAPPRLPLAVVGVGRGEGRSFVAANLAIAFCQLGGETLLIDADMRNAAQHRLFAIENTIGLSTLLSGRGSLDAVQSVELLPKLRVLPAGPTPPNPGELMEQRGFVLLLQEFTRKFDYVIVDTPAARSSNETRTIVARCGAFICVARKHHSHARRLQTFAAAVKEGGSRAAAVVLNEY